MSHILDPARLFVEPPPRLEITNLRRGDDPVEPGARLPWSDQPLHIELTALGAYDDFNRIRIRYRLGPDRPWLYSRSLVIEQPSLQAGSYVFEAQLIDGYRRIASPPATLAFEVAPRWWASWPAWLGYALAALGLLTLIWRWRHRRRLRRERRLSQLVTTRTAELEREKHELESARATLALKAMHDELTGLLNRAGILEALAAGMAEARASGRPLAVVLIDLDHFKQVNDHHGHLAGDAVLAETGRRLHACLRGADKVGRYGGEELLAILPGFARDAQARVQAIHDAIRAAPYMADEYVVMVTCSVGVAWYRDGESVEKLLGRADMAMYRAKRNGRDRIELET